MGRPKKKPTLDEQIEAAKEKVVKTKIPYNAALNELNDLIMLKKQAEKKSNEERLQDALSKSKRSFDDIIKYILSDPEDEYWDL